MIKNSDGSRTLGNGKVVSKRKMFWINVVGTLAALLSSVTLVPQVYKLVNTRDVSSLSLYTSMLVMCTSILWITYNLMVGMYHGIFSSSLNFINACIITYIVVDVRYRGGDGIDNSTEQRTK